LYPLTLEEYLQINGGRIVQETMYNPISLVESIIEWFEE